MVHGTCSKSSLSCLSPSPTHFDRQSAPFRIKNDTFLPADQLFDDAPSLLSGMLSELARARAVSVFLSVKW